MVWASKKGRWYGCGPAHRPCNCCTCPATAPGLPGITVRRSVPCDGLTHLGGRPAGIAADRHEDLDALERQSAFEGREALAIWRLISRVAWPGVSVPVERISCIRTEPVGRLCDGGDLALVQQIHDGAAAADFDDQRVSRLQELLPHRTPHGGNGQAAFLRHADDGHLDARSHQDAIDKRVRVRRLPHGRSGHARVRLTP